MSATAQGEHDGRPWSEETEFQAPDMRSQGASGPQLTLGNRKEME